MLGKSQCGRSILIPCYDKSELWETFVHYHDEYLSPQHVAYLLSIFSKSHFAPRNSKLPSNISWLAFSFWGTEPGILPKRAPFAVPGEARAWSGLFSRPPALSGLLRIFFAFSSAYSYPVRRSSAEGMSEELDKLKKWHLKDIFYFDNS